jgi:hypothetical protein
MSLILLARVPRRFGHEIETVGKTSSYPVPVFVALRGVSDAIDGLAIADRRGRRGLGRDTRRTQSRHCGVDPYLRLAPPPVDRSTPRSKPRSTLACD